jgi:hypothetical protein
MGCGIGEMPTRRREDNFRVMDAWIGSVRYAMIDRLGMPLPGTPKRPFQAGRSNGVTKELL